MPKPKTQRPLATGPEENTAARQRTFHAFLAAADHVALELILQEGISTDSVRDRNFYYCECEDLAKQFGGTYRTTDVDGICTLEELSAKMEAAHMVGLALGLRMRGFDLGTGGAR